MGKIRLLPDDVASQVAAGEVVERPASVIKELVENSIDAGATHVSVEFAGGGTKLIRIQDNGCGMDREDALLSLERHATSKIRTAADLSSVGTMGFRGEALPSIASVSRFKMFTRPADSACGTEIIVSGGRLEGVAEAGGPTGTSIEVRSLFYNLPARKKFLRSEATEAAHVLHQLESLAMAHPDLTLTVTRDGKKVWDAPAAADPAVRIRDVLGADLLSRLLALEAVEAGGIRISGFIARPGEARPDRDRQFVVVNGRVVHCGIISHSLREAYADGLPRGRHPIAVLWITMDPASFDCNVHPAKREIRLLRPDPVRQAVHSAVTARLQSHRRAGTGPADFAPRGESLPERRPTPAPTTPAPAAVEPAADPVRFSTQPPLPGEKAGEAHHAGAETSFQLRGPLGTDWILIESTEGLVLLDVRAASERILYEEMAREASQGAVRSQRLLLPEIVEPGPKDAAWIAAHTSDLASAGFLVEPFGGNAVKVEALPAYLASSNAAGVLLDICARIRATGSPAPGKPLLDALVRSVCRLASLEPFRYEEGRAKSLVRRLLACDLPYACPQGRPTMLQWSFQELERKFGR